jgi:hypothetical protein
VPASAVVRRIRVGPAIAFIAARLPSLPDVPAPAAPRPVAPRPAAPASPAGSAPWPALRSSCFISASATPMPRFDICCASCWSSIDVYIFDVCESSSPPSGVASRMLLSIISVNIASNWPATAFAPACGDAFACARSASKPCTSSAKRCVRSFAFGRFAIR